MSAQSVESASAALNEIISQTHVGILSNQRRDPPDDESREEAKSEERKNNNTGAHDIHTCQNQMEMEKRRRGGKFIFK
jgi:hypothetical protein